ncbi:hypothetical protein I5M27_02795 [Adhaeribacter sp. BT258]|uniref:Por secretion system C-terminal sorting domain-containing protein n=1 Tax=Adhaeribacter terrigena TaxID=2793070 RepID=A0ABS1BXU2_9BACT|nr:hypothetical protein [Adhaeribacter terrigena]MBK0401895.1 hypothetical protein [Adhaeribacter terrigena]
MLYSRNGKGKRFKMNFTGKTILDMNVQKGNNKITIGMYEHLPAGVY